MLSSKLIAVTVDFFERNLIAAPGKTFCSWIIVGMFKRFAANTTGAQTYPPVPTTASGLNAEIIDKHLSIPVANFIPGRRFFILLSVENPSTSMYFISNPSFGISLFSRPFFVPINSIFESGSFDNT